MPAVEGPSEFIRWPLFPASPCSSKSCSAFATGPLPKACFSAAPWRTRLAFEDARLIFSYGKSLDPTLAGNHYNYAVTLDRMGAPVAQRRRAWQEYLTAAVKDPKQTPEARRRAEEHLKAIEH